MPRASLLFVVVSALNWTASAAVDTSKLPAAASAFDFDRDIRPLLEQHCVECHGAEKQKGKFRLDARDFLLKGGENGVDVIPGKSAESALIHAVARLDEDTAMPPKQEKALPPAKIALLRAWIDAGAPYPEGFIIRNRVTGAVRLDPEELAKLPPVAERKIGFVKDVQPIFSDHCHQCHGEKRQEAAFRLDDKATVLAGGELGVALVPGKSAESLLIHFVAGLRPEGRMPKKGDALTAEQIGILRAWIDQGAEFPDVANTGHRDNRAHWAFKPPITPALPTVDSSAANTANPIDAFIGARLAKEHLTWSPEADKATLLRRLHLDLTGLPPSVEELDAFLLDAAPDAYDRLVERLLASPHYGERWGRHWLDAARYADTNGYEKDAPRIAHFYRDWVVSAFNRDLPYDRFIIEQLAGDQLPNPTQEQIVATGFLRNSMINEEGGVDPEQFRMEAMFDRMEAIGKAMLGLTIQCSQCHNHKYDPITQEEYYKIFAFLNNDHEAQPRVYSPDEHMRRADVLRQIGEIESKLQHETPDWRERMAKWENEWRAKAKPEWHVFQPEVDKNTTGGQRYLPQPDGSVLAGGYQPTKSTCNASWKTAVKGITGFRLEMLHDPNLPANGPGRSFMGTFGLTEFAGDAAALGAKAAPMKFVKATADLETAPETTVHPNFNEKQPVRRVIGPASYAIDGKDDTAWASDLGPGRQNLESAIVFALEKPVSNEGETQYSFRLKQNHGGWNSDDLQGNNLGKFRLSYTTSPNPEADQRPPHVREILATPPEKRSTAQMSTLFSTWRLTVPEWKEANQKIEELWKQHPEGTTQMTLAARAEMRQTSVLKRGDWLKPANSVNPGVPAILNPLPADAPATRLTLAKWMTDTKAPTTARAFVNRVWQTYFGTGIVATSEDLGTQCEPPSHPELLDWLACEFMQPTQNTGGEAKPWSIKHLHRLIVKSRAYKQSSVVTPELLAKDPYNRLLARGARFRVEGEIVRDIQLAASGLLNPKLGGRAVMPPAPEFIFQPPASYAPYPWKEETGEDRYRRALYTLRRRTTPFPMLGTFDVPEGNTACVRRTRANTPLQALITLNETVSVEAAQALARRILEKGGAADVDRIWYAFRRVLSRQPSDAERETLLQLIAKQKTRVADGWINPWLLAANRKEAPPENLPPKVTPSELAAYTVVSRVLLNLDETITKE
jgi:mono/diheme cytochrome c family protein